ncbi:GroES-like protein [Rhizodiscina lignyota]|uniref:GroES-like protein n=1 Tax=Rhizodiscina lignyota TaxID=1504668 RepID=A0A9P4M2W2_9PEZI|nr:GroES-like protein [Rhizodiscina lignyota]
MASRPSTMHAWQKVFGSSEPVRNQVPVPAAPPDGLLVKIHAAGVCHSDVALLKQENRAPAFKGNAYTLGHEGCGEVVEIGSSVPADAFKVGDMVAILSVAGCGASSCGECSRDLAQICRAGEKYGITHDGAYAPYIAIKTRAATKLPDGVTPEQGAVATDACMTAFHAVVGTAQVKRDETVLIVGIGGLGFNALQVAQWIGAKVFVADKRQKVLEEARKFGVPEEDIVPVGETVQEFVKRKDLVIDTIIDFVGVQETFTASQEAVRFGGKLVQVGLLAPHITVNNFLSVRKHLSILCSYGGTMEDLKQCLELISKAKLRPQVVNGSLDGFPQVLEDLHAGKVKSRIALVPNA